MKTKRKNSSGCFAWSWKVSAPKKVSGKTRGKEREVERGKTAAQACSASSPRASSVRGYQKKLCRGVLGGDISLRGDARRKSALPGKPGVLQSSSEHPRLAALRVHQGKDAAGETLAAEVCIAEDAKFRLCSAGGSQA